MLQNCGNSNFKMSYLCSHHHIYDFFQCWDSCGVYFQRCHQICHSTNNWKKLTPSLWCHFPPPKYEKKPRILRRNDNFFAVVTDFRFLGSKPLSSLKHNFFRRFEFKWPLSPSKQKMGGKVNFETSCVDRIDILTIFFLSVLRLVRVSTSRSCHQIYHNAN